MIRNLRGWFYLSVVAIAISLTLIGVFRLQLGVDFTGGSLLEVGVLEGKAAAAERDSVVSFLRSEFQIGAVVQATQDNTLLIRTSPLNQDTYQEIVQQLREQQLAREELRFETIGPTIGAELRRKAIWASWLVVVGMILYLTYAFRKSGGLIAPWKFGVAATYALLHDLLFVTAIFVILGRTRGILIDSLFVTAMLAVMGYSVNDTIVLFDRLREEWGKARSEKLSTVIARAVRLSAIRSINTSLTILLVLVVMLVVGGASIRWFIVALTAGTLVGTYSSIFVAAPCLYMLYKRNKRTT